MTKQAPDDIALKCHVTMEEANKMVEDTTKMLDITALVVCDAQACHEREGKSNRTIVKNRMNSFRNRLGRVMRRLYDLESSGEPERPLNIDLDLYQMENY